MPRRFFYDTEFMERPSTIDLISIGVVSEGDREFYAVNTGARLGLANPWVKDNIISKLPPITYPPALPWMSHLEISHALLEFMKPTADDPVELWGYYSAYDHVALCWLFGPMVDLPPGMPMYTRDIKQWCDEMGNPQLPQKPDDEHSAIADARWNKAAWEFLAWSGAKPQH